MESITIVMFIVVFALTILFSVLAWEYESDILSFVAVPLWFALGLLNLGLMFEVEPMFYPLSYFYYVVGMIFFVLGIAFLFGRFQHITQHKQEQEMELR